MSMKVLPNDGNQNNDIDNTHRDRENSMIVMKDPMLYPTILQTTMMSMPDTKKMINQTLMAMNIWVLILTTVIVMTI